METHLNKMKESYKEHQEMVKKHGYCDLDSACRRYFKNIPIKNLSPEEIAEEFEGELLD